MPTTERLGKLSRGIDAFRRLATDLSAARAQVSDITLQLQDSERQLESLKTEISDVLGELGECPVCGSASHPDPSPALEVSSVGGVQ